MRKLRQYKKILSRDFCLPSIEVWVRGETTNPKGWTKKMQPFLPYIIAERTDNTVHFHYDVQGVTWIQELLVKLAHLNVGFIPIIEKKVMEKISFIRPIYEKEVAIDISTLKRFLKELEEGYPWFEAMWWFFQMNNESKTEKLELKNLAKVRQLTDRLCNSSDTVIRKSLLKIYPQLGNSSAVLRTKEIISGNIPNKSDLEKREQVYFFATDKLLTALDRSNIEKIFNVHFEPDSIKKIRVLNGLPAYKGLVRGFVRRVMGHKQIADLQEGEILVSPMTIPDFIPAMKKAAAIVTDEGGTLSHAAIIAREFGKPTVVGTTIATNRLRDGDMVEVNATEGKVSLICHAAIIANKLKKPCIIGTEFSTELFKDGDYVEVDADKGIITLINRKQAEIKRNISWNTLFQENTI